MCKSRRLKSTRASTDRHCSVASSQSVTDALLPLSRSQIGDVKKENLPGYEALDSPGKKEGAVIMVKAPNGTVEAHSVRCYGLRTI